jgi:hypothetical protein
VLARTPMFLVHARAFHSRAVLHWELNMANSMPTSALPLCLSRLRFNLSMTTIPSLWRMGAGWRLWRFAYDWLIPWLFWWQFVASLAWVSQTLVLCALIVMSVCNISFVELLMFLFGVFRGMCGESLCNVFCYSSWYFGSLLSPRCFAGGQ